FFFQAEDGIRDDLVTGVQTCALPIWGPSSAWVLEAECVCDQAGADDRVLVVVVPGAVIVRATGIGRAREDEPDSCPLARVRAVGDRKSTRLNSSHQIISYAVFCLKKQ